MMLVAIAILLLAVLTGSRSQPNSGVELNSETLQSTLSNNSLISSSLVGGDGRGIICFTAAGDGTTTPGDSVWEDTNGDNLQQSGFMTSSSIVLYIQRRPQRITLYRGGVEFSSENEGVYACHINDENGDRQTLLIGIYLPETLHTSAGPVVHTATFSLLTDLTTHPSQFTITCPSSFTPPLSTEWSRDGTPLTVGGGQFNTSQVLVNPATSRYDNVLSVSGDMVGEYKCVVSNDNGTNEASFTVRVPSGPPMGVQATPGGNGSVHVSWTEPVDGATGYAIYYRPTDSPGDQTLSVRVNDAAATSYTIESILPETEYTIRMLAYAELASTLSNTATIYLDVPGQPTDVVVTPTSSSSITVQWEGPINVDGYVIMYNPITTVDCAGMVGGKMTVTGQTESVVTGLEEGTDYIVRVAAFNSFGRGQFSETPVAVYTEERAPSGTPRNLSVTPSPPDALSVSWQPPDCLLWNARLLTNYTLHYHSLTHSRGGEGGGGGGDREVSVVVSGERGFTLSGLRSFTNYSVSMSASNRKGSGPRSEEVVASLVTAPGELESVSYQPDILSVIITWDPPERGRGYITMVTVEYYNSEGVKLDSASVGSEDTMYRVRNLHPLSTYNVTLTPHTSDPTPGPTHLITVSTIGIGSVMSMKVVVFNSSAVNVSWTPLPSIHVTLYTVYFSQLADDGEQEQESGSEMFMEFPVERGEQRAESGVGWGLVGRLEEGAEYRFTVVAVVVVDGDSMKGDESEPVTITVETNDNTGDGGIEAVIIISSTAAALLVVLVMVGLVIVIITCCLIRRYRRSGKMEIASAMELRQYRKPLPLPNYDPPDLNFASCRPEIVDAPTDIIAVEGERVDFKLKVLGSPEPSVVWYHNGCMVGPDYATEISNDGGLTLVAVEPNHEGTYRYTVSNSVGSIQGKVTLYVTSETGAWDHKRRGGMDLPTVTSELVTVDQFPQYMSEKMANGGRGLRDQYLCLSSCEENHTTLVALLPANKIYNRFLNIVPYDDNRVKLKPLSGREDCQHDYINASYINGYGIAKKFVATQGPTDATVVDFWRMVWQLHSPTIAMMTNLTEGRKKCERYWPEFGTVDYGPYTITLAEQKVLADYTIRKLTLTSSFSTRRLQYITHYQFTSWPDHKVPACVSPLLDFHHRLTRDHRPNKGPIILHCSAGVGRSGAFIVLDTALGQARGERRMDIPDILTRLRNQRMKMVQTPEQYIFVHKAILEGLTCSSTRIEASQLEATLTQLSAQDPQLECSHFEEQFALLEEMSPHPENNKCRMAMQHPHKNRNMDYLPTDQWRVVLKDERPDYIHACFGCDYRQKHAFIITQAPLETTCRDFWKMVYERECGVIVMLSGLVEGGRVNCQRYWPTNAVELYGEYAVTPLEEHTHDDFLERVFSVIDSKGGETHYMSQFQVLGWTSDGRASNPVGIVKCMLHAENVQRTSGDSPIVVHCSDGVTRSGIFCAGMAAIQCCRSEGSVDIFQAVRALRQQRPGAVPTLQHYKLLHKLLLIFVQKNYSTYPNNNMCTDC